MCKNGLSWPLTPAQIGSWLVLLADLGTAAGLLLTSDWTTVDWTVFISYAVATVVLLVVGLLTTTSNPVGNVVVERVPGSSRTVFYCTVCEHPVAETTKHCTNCNRCVDQFDHHCRWINNCVSKKNYSLFVGLAVSVEIKSAATLVLYSLAFDGGVETVLVVLAGAMLVTYAFVLLANSWLLLMHIYFKARGLTTYEFLRRRNARRVQADKAPLPTDGGPPVHPPGSMQRTAVAVTEPHEDSEQK